MGGRAVGTLKVKGEVRKLKEEAKGERKIKRKKKEVGMGGRGVGR